MPTETRLEGPQQNILGLDFAGLVAWHKPGRAGAAVRREECQPGCTGECMLSPSSPLAF